MADLPLREDRIRVPLPGRKGKWSEWKKAMVPYKTVDKTGTELTEERGPNQDGYTTGECSGLCWKHLSA